MRRVCTGRYSERNMDAECSQYIYGDVNQRTHISVEVLVCRVSVRKIISRSNNEYEYRSSSKYDSLVEVYPAVK